MDNVTSEPAPTYLQLRDRIMHLDPHELGLHPSPKSKVWGMVMETGYEVGTASLVVLVDGTTSLYYSTGGGLLGSPEYSPLADAAKVMVTKAGDLTDLFARAQTTDLPAIGVVNFILLSLSGKLIAAAPEKILTSTEHPLSQLYHLGREILKLLSHLKDKNRV